VPPGRPLRPNDPDVITGLATALTPVRRPGPLDIAWHWRWEIGTTAILAGFTTLIATSLGSTGLIAAAGAGLAALSTLMCWPPARARLIARVLCVITPHRIRKGCANAWIQTRGGSLPIVLSCTPADYGERARLWLLAGLTADDLLVAREVLAVACWAAEVRVLRDADHAHRVTLEVIRRPLPERTRPLPYRSWPDAPAGEADASDPEQRRLRLAADAVSPHEPRE
jgi:hypothetical protein